VFVIFTHAAPAEIVIAPDTLHVWAAAILLDASLALWTFAHVTQEEECEESDPPLTGTSSFVPSLLAVKTCVCATLFAH